MRITLSLLLLAAAAAWRGASGEEFYCPIVSEPGTDRRTNATTFRLVQFNAEWLFVDGADSCPGSTCP